LSFYWKKREEREKGEGWGGGGVVGGEEGWAKEKGRPPGPAPRRSQCRSVAENVPWGLPFYWLKWIERPNILQF
jgi:hypothetical protein